MQSYALCVVYGTLADDNPDGARSGTVVEEGAISSQVHPPVTAGGYVYEMANNYVY